MEPKEYISSGILELYVLGIATAEETAEVRAMAERYPEVKDELRSIEGSMESYAISQSIEPASSIKNKIISGIGGPSSIGVEKSSSSSAPVISISPLWRSVAAAAILFLAGSLYFNLSYYNKYETAKKGKQQAEETLVARQQENDKMHNDMSGMENDWKVIQSKNSMPVALNPLPNKDAAAKIFWMKNTSGEVYIDPSNLPAAPKGMQYQFWGIVDGKPVDGGMIITTDKNNTYRIQKMKTVFKGVNVQAFAVTLETAGGNPQPKGEMYVMGKM